VAVAMAGEARLKRLADNVARLAAEIVHTELKEPLPGVVTITGATVAKDLQSAKVFYTVLGDADARSQAARRLKRVSSFVQREIGKRLHLRVTPVLTFVYDDSLERGSNVLRLLAELKRNDEDRNTDS